MNWSALKELRTLFLGDSARLSNDDYWTEEILQLYDATFGQRIAWKWMAVLKEATHRQYSLPPHSTLVDWGCGTAIASRIFLKHFGHSHISKILLLDRSSSATHFAKQAIEREFPGVLVELLSGPIPENSITLLSHVVNELPASNLDSLCRQLTHCSQIIWVEPGTKTHSRSLIQCREMLRQEFQILSPCQHQLQCGLLTTENNQHWCHHFAEPPREVFQSKFWNDFSQQLKIDLRSLPLSYLILSRHKEKVNAFHSSLVIGRPRLYKGNGKFLLCDESGVRDTLLLERRYKADFKLAKTNPFHQTLTELDKR